MLLILILCYFGPHLTEEELWGHDISNDSFKHNKSDYDINNRTKLMFFSIKWING